MYELTITPKIYTMVSTSARKFIGSDANIIKTVVQKPYEYVGSGSKIEKEIPAQNLPTRYPYFSPDTIIDRKNEEVAKNIRVLG